MSYKCCVLLSTYNGEKYIYQQLESLYNQTIGSGLVVYIRDDGSKDRTCELIRGFHNDHPEFNILLNPCSNVGVQKSFMELMKTAPEAECYAFCDQDDYWLPDKLRVAYDMLSHSEEATLYYSDYAITDADLNVIQTIQIANKNVAHSITQILYQNMVPGCTMVINKALLDECNLLDIDRIRMHDVVVLGVAYLTGKIVGDTNTRILYRQHGTNVVGYQRQYQGIHKWINEKIKLIQYGDGYHMEDTASEMLRVLGDSCNKEQKRELHRIASCKHSLLARLQLVVFRETAYMADWKTLISIRFKILFHLM